MKGSRASVPTTHAGSLPRPDDLIELNRARPAGEFRDERGYQERLGSAVGDVVRLGDLRPDDVRAVAEGLELSERGLAREVLHPAIRREDEPV